MDDGPDGTATSSAVLVGGAAAKAVAVSCHVVPVAAVQVDDFVRVVDLGDGPVDRSRVFFVLYALLTANYVLISFYKFLGMVFNLQYIVPLFLRRR